MKPLYSLLLLCTFGAAGAASVPPDTETLRHGRFETLALARPSAAAADLVIYFPEPQEHRPEGPSGRPGDAGTRHIASEADADVVAQLLNVNAAVVTVDSAAFLKSLAADGGDCAYGAGDVENLGHFIEAYLRMDSYQHPVLVGRGGGALIAQALLDQAPEGSFSGAVALDAAAATPPVRWCGPDGRPRTAPPSLATPWQTHDDTQVNETYALLRKAVPLAAASDGAETLDMPVVEVPAKGRPQSLYAVLISGDGGWAGLDEKVASALSEAGITVIGLDALRYFWKERTPDSTAADMDRLIRHYNRRLQLSRLMLIGYSQGADVLPFILNRLPTPSRRSIVLPATLALSSHAAFEFHVGAWFGKSGSTPTLPEVQKLAGQGLVCIYGRDDEDALGPSLDRQAFHVVELPGSHHFDGNYALVARTLLAALPSIPTWSLR